ncbi:UNVERIFIED_CONTAM: hypothetical protein Sindi_1733200, partial [Sesamum indicum]
PSPAPRSFFGGEDFLGDDNRHTLTSEEDVKGSKQALLFQSCIETFIVDVFISEGFVSASFIQRASCKPVVAAGTNSKDFMAALKIMIRYTCVVGHTAGEAYACTASYTPRGRDKLDAEIRAVVQSLIDNGIDV